MNRDQHAGATTQERRVVFVTTSGWSISSSSPRRNLGARSPRPRKGRRRERRGWRVRSALPPNATWVGCRPACRASSRRSSAGASSALAAGARRIASAKTAPSGSISFRRRSGWSSPSVRCNACRACEQGVTRSPAPARPIGGALPTEGLLAHALASMHADHLPHYRLSRKLARSCVDLHRSTLAGRVGKASFHLRPVVDCLAAEPKRSSKLGTDETTVRVLVPGRTKTGHSARATSWCLRHRRARGRSPPPRRSSATTGAPRRAPGRAPRDCPAVAGCVRYGTARTPGRRRP
ncbi:MAG: transposase [Gammaproteobacteria bacterium]|nr:transposase [Gammaproteobacteria bacterium]